MLLTAGGIALGIPIGAHLGLTGVIPADVAIRSTQRPVPLVVAQCPGSDDQHTAIIQRQVAFSDALAYLRVVQCGCGTAEDHVCRAVAIPNDPVDWQETLERFDALLEARQRLTRRIETGGAE